MKEKKSIKIHLSTFLLILVLPIIIIMSYFLYKLHNEKIIQESNVHSLNNEINNLNNQITNLENILVEKENILKAQNTNIIENSNIASTNNYEKIIINRNMVDKAQNYNEAISTFLTYVWANPEAYEECIAEFQDVRNAPKDYLAACASLCAMKEDNNSNNNVEFNEFNNMLIKLFGENADGILKESDLDNAICIIKNSDNTYSFTGFCGSEISSTEYDIKNIKQDGNLFYVELYEYKTKLDKPTVLLENDEITHEYVYDRKNNLILTITIKSIPNGNEILHKYYDETGNELIKYDNNGNYIDPVNNLLLTNYQKKLSIRKITLQYLENTNSFIMLNNKLEN